MTLRCLINAVVQGDFSISAGAWISSRSADTSRGGGGGRASRQGWSLFVVEDCKASYTSIPLNWFVTEFEGLSSERHLISNSISKQPPCFVGCKTGVTQNWPLLEDQVPIIFQASWGRSGKQQQEQHSPNLRTIFISPPLYCSLPSQDSFPRS